MFTRKTPEQILRSGSNPPPPYRNPPQWTDGRVPPPPPPAHVPRIQVIRGELNEMPDRINAALENGWKLRGDLLPEIGRHFQYYQVLVK